MTEAERLNTLRIRLNDALDAMATGEGMAFLAKKWGTTRPYVSQWAGKYLSPEARQKLVENGNIRGDQKKRSYDLETRIELVALCRANGWTLDKIGMALGIAHNGVWQFIQRQAPDGFEAALEDFREEEAA